MHCQQVFICLLMSVLILVKGRIINRKIIIGKSTNGVIISPKSVQDDTVYTYKLKNLNKLGTVLLYTEKFVLNKDSLFKIYDGSDTNSELYVYNYETRQVAFQSRGRYLYVVFKPRSVDSSSTVQFFKAFYKFANYGRVKTSDLAAVGACPVVGSEAAGRMVIEGGRIRVPALLDCTWEFTASSLHRYLHVYVTNTNLNNVRPKDRLEWRDNRRGTSPSVFINSTMMSLASTTYRAIIPLPTSLHLHLHTHVNDQLYIQYHLGGISQSFTGKIVKNLTGHVCPFTHCEGRESQCVYYWDSCQKSSSCNVLPLKCLNECYSEADICDGFPDCGVHKTKDEQSCDSSHVQREAGQGHLSTTSAPSGQGFYFRWDIFLGIVTTVCVLVCIYACVRWGTICNVARIYKTCMQSFCDYCLQECCPECCTDLEYWYSVQRWKCRRTMRRCCGRGNADNEQEAEEDEEADAAIQDATSTEGNVEPTAPNVVWMTTIPDDEDPIDSQPTTPTGTWRNTGDLEAPPPSYDQSSSAARLIERPGPRAPPTPRQSIDDPEPPSYNAALLLGPTTDTSATQPPPPSYRDAS